MPLEEPEYDPDWDSPEAVAKWRVRGIRDIHERAKEFHRIKAELERDISTAREALVRKPLMREGTKLSRRHREITTPYGSDRQRARGSACAAEMRQSAAEEKCLTTRHFSHDSVGPRLPASPARLVGCRANGQIHDRLLAWFDMRRSRRRPFHFLRDARPEFTDFSI